MAEDLPGLGHRSRQVFGRQQCTFKQVLLFNGKDLVHGTMAWAAGDRFAVIPFSIADRHGSKPIDKAQSIAFGR
jgi:hypothetical protein